MAVFNWMVEFTIEHFYQPSYREVMARFGFASTNSVSGYIQAFERKGLVRAALADKRAIEFLRRVPIGAPADA